MSNVCLSPKETSDALINSAAVKASYPAGKRMLLSMAAGFYIALGGHGFIVAYESLFLRAAVFPVGLMLIVLVGGELFTGNCLMTFGVLNKTINMKDFIKTLVQVWLGNFAGALLAVAIFYLGGVYAKPSLAETIAQVANAKVSLSFMQVIMRGILCNILVSLGVWFALTARDTAGKILGCWFPVMLFVLCGYEHSVANMFFLPMGMLFNPSVTVALVLKNIIAATIGNFIGGGVMVPVVYYKCYYKL